MSKDRIRLEFTKDKDGTNNFLIDVNINGDTFFSPLCIDYFHFAREMSRCNLLPPEDKNWFRRFAKELNDQLTKYLADTEEKAKE